MSLGRGLGRWKRSSALEEIDAIIRERQSVEAWAERSEPPAKTGRPKKGVVSTPLPKGEHAARLTARIARDRPDILGRMKAGEFRSVRQAAIAVGIVTPRTPPTRALRASRFPVGWKIAIDCEWWCAPRLVCAHRQTPGRIWRAHATFTPAGTLVRTNLYDVA